jgi:death-on-curing protein
VRALHERLIAEHGGRPGVRDEGLLESALARPPNLLAYGRPDLFDLAAAYAQGLVRDHPFIDGNKRAALMAAYVFLDRNGYRLTAPEAEAAIFVVDLAAGRVSEPGFAAWLRKSSTRLRSRRREPPRE